LTRSEERFRIQADAMPQMVWSTDPQGNHLYYNRRWYEYTGQTVEESIGFGFALALHPDDKERTLVRWQRSWSGGEHYEIEYRMQRHDGVYRWFVGRAEPVLDPETGEVTMWVGTCTDIDDLKALEMERERLLQEQRRLLLEELARAEKQALVNEIGEAVRAALEPTEVLRVTVEALGKALQADRCYFVTYDLGSDWGRIKTDWYRSGLSSLVGEFRLSNLALNREAAFQSGQTQVVNDVHERPAETLDAPTASTPLPPGFSGGDVANVSLMDTLGLRSLIRAPLLSPGEMTALTVAMSDRARRWTQDEVRLVETVAAQTRAAVESARLQQRERNIAQTLQAALQPPPPSDLPGLVLREFYKPALAEAGVGGDFYDIFPIEKGCTALVVGDLSGKGLAAASEVATVRNMVRYAVYSGRTLAEAITDLDRILVEHSLLTGFATLFVGLYDQNEHTLTYVNCGQEPGLIWRAATGAVESLLPTGPVLGGFESMGGYEEAIAALAPGDILALFTDGMTEVGPTRKQFLEIEGLTDLFARCCSAAIEVSGYSASEAATSVRDSLIAEVEAYAGSGSGTGDDIALLVGVAAVPGTAR
jgi:PAS domain S-box-containing protein